MVATVRDDTPSYSMVKERAPEIGLDIDSLEDDPHQGRLPTVTTQEAIGKTHDMIFADQ